MQVFISYAREDEEYAWKLYWDLRNAGLNPWLDKQALFSGKEWKPQIKEAIKSSRYFIPLLSRNSVMSEGFVRDELRLALDILDEIRKPDVFIIPVRLDNIDVTERKLSPLHFVDLFSDWNHGVQNVLRTIRSRAQPLAPSPKYGMRGTEIGLGMITLLLSLAILVSPADTAIPIAMISIALLIIGIERIISGTFSPGKGRRAILGLGILVVIVSLIVMVLPINYIIINMYLLLAIAFFIDSVARIYFGIANKTTSRRSRIFSIITGIAEIILSIMVLRVPISDYASYAIFTSAIAIMVVGIQMMAAGIAGRRLTIAR